jgi:hypothetical protein
MRFLGLNGWIRDRHDKILRWPPDVFAATAFLLRESGAYLELGRPGPAGKVRLQATSEAWHRSIKPVALEWSQLTEKACPKRVRELWKTCKRYAKSPVAEVGQNDELWQAIVELCCTADEACSGLGLPSQVFPQKFSRTLATAMKAMETVFKSFRFRIMYQLIQQLATGAADKENLEASTKNRPASTLCRLIDSSRVVVLPKMRTSQRGMTIRSMTHHISLYSGSDIRPYWFVSPEGPKTIEAKAIPRIPRHGGPSPRKVYNVLVLPWPLEVFPVQFYPLKGHRAWLQRTPSTHNYFAFREGDLPSNFDQKIQRLIRNAGRIVGPIHALVLPEMAMTQAQFTQVFHDQIPDGLEFLVCGVYEPPTQDKLASNYAQVLRREPNGNKYEHKQYKHHRWALDEQQIRTYGLGCALDPSTVWWEGIDLPQRSLAFFSLDDLCVFTVLICEDLARPDPVGDLVRAVGPNLVISILQDGPQLSGRWSGRHATVLADDPGCSVLTVTSLGMSLLSRPGGRDGRHSADNSRIVALWRDTNSGMREIVLPPNDHGVVLSLTETTQTEYTADGRGDGEAAGCIKLGGVHGVNWHEH